MIEWLQETREVSNLTLSVIAVVCTLIGDIGCAIRQRRDR